MTTRTIKGTKKLLTLWIYGNYGHGWEPICYYGDAEENENIRNAREDLKACRENEGRYARFELRRKFATPDAPWSVGKEII